MQEIIISIHPEHVKNIFSGKKTIELRKSIPHIEMPFKAVIYETNNGGIVGEFIVNGFDFYKNDEISMFSGDITKKACIYHCELWDYIFENDLYAWHISNPLKYGDAIPLECFGLKRPPQSWQYLKWRVEK